MQEVLPEYMGKGSLGIITPYRDQAEAINRAVGQELASTVHKYQGRECDTIIMSMVDNAPTDFSDDANLLNVAISRAKTRLCLIVTGNELPEESNLSQLINYIRYNNFEVRESQLHSVFDLLYQQYSAERLRYQTTHFGCFGPSFRELALRCFATSVVRNGAQRARSRVPLPAFEADRRSGTSGRGRACFCGESFLACGFPDLQCDHEATVAAD